MLRRNTRVGRLDDFKWIAALLVVANHTSPLESISVTADFLLTRVFARMAVPFFFMVTGYFVLYGAMQEQGGFGRIRKSLQKTGMMYLFVTLLYLPVQIYKVIREPVAATAFFGKILRAVFFDGTYYHLWYLPAAMLGLVLAFMLLRYMERKALLVAAVLYLIGLLGDGYYGLIEGIPVIGSFYEGLFTIFSYTRNGLFLAPLFILLGYEAAKNEKNLLTREGVGILHRNVERTGMPGISERIQLRILRNLIICLVFLCVEGLILHHYGVQRHDSMYLILPVCMVYLFRYLLLKQGEKRRKSSFYRKGPMLLYFLHPFMILVVRGFVKVTKMQVLLEVSPFYYVTVLMGSVAAAYACLWLSGWFKRNACVMPESIRRKKKCI